MLQHETPYPYVGSHALFVDLDLPVSRQRPELVRIQMRREGELVVSFPLRDNASGNKRVAPGALIDASELTAPEAREFHDLDRDLAGVEARIRRWAEQEEAGPKPRMSPKQKAMTARRDALKQRIIHGPIIDRLMRCAQARDDARKAA